MQKSSWNKAVNEKIDTVKAVAEQTFCNGLDWFYAGALRIIPNQFLIEIHCQVDFVNGNIFVFSVHRRVLLPVTKKKALMVYAFLQSMKCWLVSWLHLPAAGFYVLQSADIITLCDGFRQLQFCVKAAADAVVAAHGNVAKSCNFLIPYLFFIPFWLNMLNSYWIILP